MAESLINVDNLQEFSAEDLLKLTERRIALILAGGQATSANGKTFTHADLKTLYEQRDRLKMEVAEAAASADDAGGIVLAQFGEPQ